MNRGRAREARASEPQRGSVRTACVRAVASREAARALRAPGVLSLNQNTQILMQSSAIPHYGAVPTCEVFVGLRAGGILVCSPAAPGGGEAARAEALARAAGWVRRAARWNIGESDARESCSEARMVLDAARFAAPDQLL